jgi:hypothetical protein
MLSRSDDDSAQLPTDTMYVTPPIMLASAVLLAQQLMANAIIAILSPAEVIEFAKERLPISPLIATSTSPESLP